MQSLQLHDTTKLNKWWKPKASNLLAILYWVMLMTALPFSKALLLFFPSIITILGIGSFGHFINDWYDIDADRHAGKNNRLAQLSVWQRRMLVLSSLAIAFLPWIILPFNRVTIILMVFEFTFLLTYAIPPVRLKERKIWPLIADSAYAYAIPAVMAAYTFFLAGAQLPDRYFLGSVFCWQMLLGIRHYLNHLALDRLNDLTTQTRTLATQKGNAFIHKLIRNYILPAEILCFISVLLTIGFYDPFRAVAVSIFFIFFSFLSLILAVGRSYSFFSCRFSKTTLDSFYQNGWPLVPLFFLLSSDWKYSFLILGHILLFFSFFLRGTQRFGYLFFLPVLYPVIYPFIFLKRKVISINKKEDKAKEKVSSVAVLHSSENRVSREKMMNIAIVNINKSKYSETFINESIPHLKYNIRYLYGGELPLFDGEARPFLSTWKNLKVLAEFLEKLLFLEENYFLKQSISNYLQAKKIQLVLAHFGPVAVQMFSITRNIGIPIVVYFHGYDVYNRKIVDNYGKEYKELFREAKKIIGVSNHMLDRLNQLGAPEEKLIHLPAYVNLELFPYSDHSQLPPNFITVGRFTEIKSPHLTILAFHKVVQKIPEATLTMIGKGEVRGGELFEACLILARALGIEKNIEFKGVLSHKDVAGEMQHARIFIQHSLTTPENEDMEGKPVAIMEAMACGLPVISTRHSGIMELIEHEVTGILVNEYDVDAMAEAMLLLAENDELVKCLGLRASEKIQSHPLISNHIKILEEIIDSSIVQD